MKAFISKLPVCVKDCCFFLFFLVFFLRYAGLSRCGAQAPDAQAQRPWLTGAAAPGPSRVTGVVGGSLSVECRYAEKYKDNSKYWCKAPCLLPWKTVETKEPEREVMRGHVSIRDHPANLTFTVTLESLREDQAGTYKCGITVPFSLDPTVQVVVSVSPGEPCTPLPPLPATGLPEECQVGLAKVEI
uniref:Ig-like domain-containing protein n=1 Tax=Phocoena sinus TaxID=42100 RepID=A0A8C9EBR0_PHOSS